MLKGDIRVVSEWTSEGDRKPQRQVAVNGFIRSRYPADLYDSTRLRGCFGINLGGTAGLFLSLCVSSGTGFFVFMRLSLCIFCPDDGGLDF